MLAFYTNVLVLALMYAILAGALNVLIGETGIFSAAQAVFFGVGAYSAALFAIHVSSSLLLSAVVGMVASAVVSLILAVPAIRVRGDYFVVASLAFAIVMTAVFQQWFSVTGGDAGLTRIPPATLGSVTISSTVGYAIVALTFVIFAFVTLYLIRRAPIGRMMRAVREDEDAVAALGKSPARIRLIALVVSAALSGLAGVIYAYYVSFVDPSAFGLDTMMLLIIMVILGGTNSFLGPALGALVMQFGIASLGLLELPAFLLGPLQQILIGAALIMVVVFSPEGLTGLPQLVMGRLRRSDEAGNYVDQPDTSSPTGAA